MKINITTSYEKPLKYRVYDVDGKKRKLIKKGKFVMSADFDVLTDQNDIIVRITPKHTIKYIIALFECFVMRFAQSAFRPLAFTPNCFEEIRIKSVRCSDMLKIRYSVPPESSANDKCYGEYLVCDTNPYVREIEKKASIIKLHFALIVFGVFGIIFAIVRLLMLIIP